MNRKTIIKRGQQVVLTSCALVMASGMLQSCKDDVLTGQPSWLGNSIYERLQDEGNYTTMLRLIDDLDQHEVLGHTGSKTLFVADDQAFQEWYRNNVWGVRSYEQMTTAQKRLLLNNSMVNNAYLIELMSNARAQGDGATPEPGRTMRRETATTIYDSVYIMPVEKMPNTLAWSRERARGRAVPILRDATSAPMIHFLPAYMQYNKITDEDLAILTNHQATSTAEAWVNGKQVVERDITCKNGYIHKVSGVIESSPNMAEIAHQHANMSLWAHLMDRYSAPYYSEAASREYNRIYNRDDSVFVLRYFSSHNATGRLLEQDDMGNTVTATLKYDPGWNQYLDEGSTADVHFDAGVMIVPSNDALEYWWNNEGRELRDEYKEWDSIPDMTLKKLIDVNLLSNFSQSVPSKFNLVLNDAKDLLGITKADIDSCFMGCNGVVYLTNKVFMPAEYQSVSYPALAHATTMNVIYWAMSGGETGRAISFNFLPYLLSMDSRYAMLLPTNDAMMNFIDPSTYGKSYTFKDQSGADSLTMEMSDKLEFYYDKSKAIGQRVQATRYEVLVDEDGNWEQTSTPSRTVANNVVLDALENMLDQLIIVIPDTTKTIEDYVSEGYNYFLTKGGSMTRVVRGADGNLAFQGGWQIEHNNTAVPSTQTYKKTNGRAYQLETGVPMGAEMSVYLTLQQTPEYAAFLNLLENEYSDMLSEKLSRQYDPGMKARGNKNIRILDNYNYTIYVPTNSSIEELQKKDLLPSWDVLDDRILSDDTEDTVLDSICWARGWYKQGLSEKEMGDIREKVAGVIKNIVSDFVRYHVQDHSVAVGMAKEQNYKPFTAYESMKRNLTTGRFFPIEVNYDNQSMTVKDAAGKDHRVITTEGLFNKICREYWFRSDGRIYQSSNVVMHLIDSPLLTQDEAKMTTWYEQVEDALKN